MQNKHSVSKCHKAFIGHILQWTNGGLKDIFQLCVMMSVDQPEGITRCSRNSFKKYMDTAFIFQSKGFQQCSKNNQLLLCIYCSVFVSITSRKKCVLG